MISGCDWEMKLGFGGFGDNYLKLKNDEHGRKKETVRR